jgi:hypothetical protein
MPANEWTIDSDVTSKLEWLQPVHFTITRGTKVDSFIPDNVHLASLGLFKTHTGKVDAQHCHECNSKHAVRYFGMTWVLTDELSLNYIAGREITPLENVTHRLESSCSIYEMRKGEG